MRQNSFNVVHLAVALFCVVVFVTIAIALNQSSDRPRGRSWQSSQLRGIHQGLVTFANSNKNWFPGVNPDGTTLNLDIEYRYQVLLEGDYFTPEYAISPAETQKISEWEGPYDTDAETHPVSKDNYSYAMLHIPEEEGGRRGEWKQTLNSQAIVISDRNIGTRSIPSSIHSDKGQPWIGSVLWNDNHVAFQAVDEFETKYSNGELNEKDKLFEADGLYDALMIHTGNVKP